MSLLIVGLDVTIVNVALPSIGHDLHGSLSGLQWALDAYTLVLASLLMLSGSTADRLGRKRTFVVGLTLFSVGSLLCSLAPGLGWLVAFRMVQAVGGSMLNPVAMSIITNTFTVPRERAQAVGVWGAVVGVSMALGPVVGGLLVSSAGWRSVFWINIPVGVLAILLAVRFVPESRAPRPRRFDPIGQALMVVLLASLTFGIIEAPRRGWTSATIVAALAVAAVSLACFVGHASRREEPLIDLRFFRSIPFSAATLTAVAAFASLGGFLLVNTLYLQNVRGLSPLHAGLDTLPMAAMTMIASPISGRLVGGRGPRLPLLASGGCFMAASAMLTQLTATTSFAWLFAAYLVFGLGFGLVNAPITNAAVSGMPRAQAGVASAVASTSRQVGSTLGVAVIGALVTSRIGERSYDGLAAASHPGWWVMFSCGAAVALLGWFATTPVATESARRAAAELNPEFLGS
ncbi:MAG TPA: MFS transporter [Mycobacteriales bacterium]|nr:MFS transporter [Mycobacteriales bacterium]